MKQSHATALGFFMGSMLPAAYLSVVYPLSGDRNFPSVLGSFLVFYYFSAAVTVFPGVPTFFALKKMKLIRWWSAVGTGAFTGSIGFFAVTFGGYINLATLLRFAAPGGAAGFMVWIFWRAGRTD